MRICRTCRVRTVDNGKADRTVAATIDEVTVNMSVIGMNGVQEPTHMKATGNDMVSIKMN